MFTGFGDWAGMKIAVIGWELPPAFSGGLGVHTLNLFSEIADYIDIDLYVPSFKGLKGIYKFNVIPVPIEHGIAGNPYEITSFPDFYESVLSYNEQVVKAFDPKDVKIIHCHDWITYLSGLQLSKKYHIPLVVTVHSTEFDRSAYFNPQRRIIDIEKMGVIGADRVIAVSNYTKSIVVREYACDPDKIRVIYNGVNKDYYISGEKDYELKNRVLYFGRLTSQKGGKFFMETASKVLKVNKDIEFTVAGSGEQSSEMKWMAKEFGITDRIKFEGFVSFRESAKYYRDSDIFVLPAVSEPFGMTVLESLISGTPVIISNTTGVGEALRNVLKADYWDTDLFSEYILYVVRYKSLRGTLGSLGQIEASRFTWRRAAVQTMEVYLGL